MANPQPVYWGYSGDPVVDAMTNGFVWLLGADKTIDWSVSGGIAGEFWRNPQDVAAGATQMLSAFSYYADIKFNYVGAFRDPLAAWRAGSEIDLTLSASSAFFPSSQVWAEGFFPEPDAYATHYIGEAGDVYLNVNSQANYLSSYSPGSAGWFVFLHELGHVLGLKHPHDDGGTGRPTLAQIGLAQLDDDWGTIMSYRDDYNWNLRQWDPATPMALDVIALQFLYGPNLSTNAGDSIYRLTRQNYYETYWDASGNDTVDVSASGEGWLIALPNYQPSSVVNTKVGVAIPAADLQLVAPHYLAWLTGDIENVMGSPFADAIAGTDAANVLNGGAGDDYINGALGDDILIGGPGNDTIDGGGGHDVAYLSGTAASYHTSLTGSTRTMQGADGLDTYTNVFRFHFDNVSVAYDVDGDAGKAYRLYQAAFDRIPDIGGLGYWIRTLDHGAPLTDVAASFISSAEFASKYGSLSNSNFVIQLYHNILHREPDASGQTYWTGLVQSHTLTRAEVLAFFSESPENQADVIGVIQNGMLYLG